jgi:DNA invertase Pin-like site-specific DNA recombinase
VGSDGRGEGAGDAREISIRVFREEWLQSIDPKVHQLIISVLGWAAEMEREFICQRIREAPPA